MNIVDVRLGAITLAPPGSPVLVLCPSGFIYKGELIEDAGKAYDLFFDCMTRINAHEQRLHARLVDDARCWDFVSRHMPRVQLDGRRTFALSGDATAAAATAYFADTVEDLIAQEASEKLAHGSPQQEGK